MHWICSWNPPGPHHRKKGQQDRPMNNDSEKEIKVLSNCCQVLHQWGRSCSTSRRQVVSYLAQAAYAEINKEGASVTPDLIQHIMYCHRSRINNFTLNTPPVRKRASLTTLSCSLRHLSAAEHHTSEQYSKNTGRTKPRKHLPRSDLPWNTRQDFVKKPSLWVAALETERRCFSKVILE